MQKVTGEHSPAPFSPCEGRTQWNSDLSPCRTSWACACECKKVSVGKRMETLSVLRESRRALGRESYGMKDWRVSHRRAQPFWSVLLGGTLSRSSAFTKHPQWAVHSTPHTIVAKERAVLWGKHLKTTEPTGWPRSPRHCSGVEGSRWGCGFLKEPLWKPCEFSLHPVGGSRQSGTSWWQGTAL